MIVAKNDDCMITPLGTAIVEAMPDRKRVAQIKHDFKVHRRCPASKVYDATRVTKFYEVRGMEIKGVLRA